VSDALTNVGDLTMASRKTNSTTTRTATSAAKKSTPASRIPAVATPAPKTTASAAAKTITKAERQRLIEQAAYFRAEKSGFQGNAQEHWNAAEAEISAELAKKKIRVV
jgi:hypothetical protein